MTNAAPKVIDQAAVVTHDLLFYDGGCGFCHRLTLFVMRHDPAGALFRFAPIGGATWHNLIEGKTGDLPDSVVLRTADGRILVRADAALHIGDRLGGVWRGWARLAGLIPRWLLNLGYDGVARIRKKLFAPPQGACPILPADLRARFLE